MSSNGAAPVGPMVLVKKIEDLTLAKGKATGTFVVDGTPTDDGEFEFVLVASVPSMDMLATSKIPMVATLKPDTNFIIAETKAMGGTALVGEKMVAVDPDSGEDVSDPVAADATGKVIIPVPDGKSYHLRIVDDSGNPDPDQSPHDHDVTAQLFVRLVDSAGLPVTGQAVTITGGPDNASSDLTTDDNGAIDPVVAPGVYQVKVGDSTFTAHSLFIRDVKDQAGHYAFVVPDPPAEDAGPDAPDADPDLKQLGPRRDREDDDTELA